MENCTPIGGVFLWNNPNGIGLEVGKGRGDERASCVAKLHLFYDIFADYEGVIPGRQEVRISFGDPWTLETNCKPLNEISKEIVKVGTVRMIMQLRGKLGILIGVEGDNFDRYLGTTSGGMARAAN